LNPIGDEMSEEELTGAELDEAVARAEGYNREGDWIRCPTGMVRARYWTPKRYCSEWEHGGPIIEREHIHLSISDSGEWWAERRLMADGSQGHATSYDRVVIGRGPTPLIAAMRAFVAARQ
jgi:hypothetical protein